MIDQRTRKTNLAVGRIDHKKAYDLIPIPGSNTL